MKCKKCNGNGSHIFMGNVKYIEDVQFVIDGELMELCEKECFFCEGKGELTKIQLKAKMIIKKEKKKILSEEKGMKYIGTAFGEEIYEKDGKRYYEKTN